MSVSMREWLVVEDSRSRSVFWHDGVNPVGFIPRQEAEKLLGKDLGGTVWFTREESDKLRAHPEWRAANPGMAAPSDVAVQGEHLGRQVQGAVDPADGAGGVRGLEVSLSDVGRLGDADHDPFASSGDVRAEEDADVSDRSGFESLDVSVEKLTYTLVRLNRKIKLLVEVMDDMEAENQSLINRLGLTDRQFLAEHLYSGKGEDDSLELAMGDHGGKARARALGYRPGAETSYGTSIYRKDKAEEGKAAADGPAGARREDQGTAGRDGEEQIE